MHPNRDTYSCLPPSYLHLHLRLLTLTCIYLGLLTNSLKLPHTTHPSYSLAQSPFCVPCHYVRRRMSAEILFPLKERGEGTAANVLRILPPPQIAITKLFGIYILREPQLTLFFKDNRRYLQRVARRNEKTLRAWADHSPQISAWRGQSLASYFTSVMSAH